MEKIFGAVLSNFPTLGNSRDWLHCLGIILDKALVELSAKFPRTAHVVQLRFLVGFTTEEAATELGLSPATVKREWTFARAWLAAAMETPTETASRQP